MFYMAISKSISLFEISMAAINIRHKLARVLVILRRRRKRRQKAKAKTKRKFWISPLNAKRSLLGAYNSTFLLMMMMMNCFCGMVDRRRALVKPYFHPGPLSEILTIANPRHAASRI